MYLFLKLDLLSESDQPLMQCTLASSEISFVTSRFPTCSRWVKRCGTLEESRRLRLFELLVHQEEGMNLERTSLSGVKMRSALPSYRLHSHLLQKTNCEQAWLYLLLCSYQLHMGTGCVPAVAAASGSVFVHFETNSTPFQNLSRM